VKAGQRFDYDEGSANLLLAFSNNSLYLDTVAMTAHGISTAAFEEVLIQTARKMPHIADAYTLREMPDSTPAGTIDTVAQMLGRAYFPGRRREHPAFEPPPRRNHEDQPGNR
jgi:hypothetical protein